MKQCGAISSLNVMLDINNTLITNMKINVKYGKAFNCINCKKSKTKGIKAISKYREENETTDDILGIAKSGGSIYPISTDEDVDVCENCHTYYYPCAKCSTGNSTILS